ncbi:MAG: agmatinase [candidate division WOR-3 bacterium]|nr:agmatinase [candidate division WOR-3 bacterium]
MALYFATATLTESQTVVLGVPYDRSSSFLPGCRLAPNQIRLATENIESYSPYFNKDVADLKIYDANDIILSYATIKDTFEQIQNAISDYLKNGKKILFLGGEHTITLPIISEFKKFYPDLNLIQFDAHTDMRDEYLGEKICHATVIRRIAEILPLTNIFQLGIRSLTGPAKNDNLFLFKVETYLDEIIKKIDKRPCYLTLDIDVLDCGIMPAVQTPEPGGISYHELFASIVKLSGLNVVGCDVVEYNPLADSNLAYASAVAEIARELIIMMDKSR